MLHLELDKHNHTEFSNIFRINYFGLIKKSETRNKTFTYQL